MSQTVMEADALAAAPASRVLLLAQDISRGDGTALADASFNVLAGDVLAVIGKPGAGCGELLELLTGQAGLRTGRITVMGQVFEAPHSVPYGVIPAAPDGIRVDTDMTVRQNVERSMGWHIPVDEQKPRAEATMRMFDLTGLAERPAWAPTAGELALLRLAMSTAASRGLLVLHNPTKDMDARRRAGAHDALRALAGAGFGIILFSDDPTEIEALATRVLVLDRTVRMRGSVNDLIERYAPGIRLVVRPVEPSEAPMVAELLRQFGFQNTKLDRSGTQVSATHRDGPEALANALFRFRLKNIQISFLQLNRGSLSQALTALGAG
jgi:ABC-type multidrug transport system ATPase subunit